MSKQPLHILLVEDNPGDSDLIRELMVESEQFSCTFNLVSRVSEALDFLVRQPVDLILLDLGLPDVQGMATMNRMRQAAESTPLVVLTGHDETAIGVDVIRAGAQDYLIKGKVNVDMLERVIRYALERHRSHHRLRESEQLLLSTLDALSAHIAILEPFGTIIALNRAWMEFATTNDGDSAVVGLGANYLAVCDASAAAGDGLAASVGEGIRAVIDGTIPSLQIEYPCHSPTEERWFDLRVTPFPGMEKRRVVVAHEDITARKLAERGRAKSENVFEKVFETIPLGLWLTDASGTLLRINPEGTRIWGAKPLVSRQEYGIFKAKRLPGGEPVQPHEWAMHRALLEGISVHDELLEIDAFDGEQRTILNSCVPLRDEAGKIEGVVISNLDITKRRQAEEALIASEQRLRLVFDTSPNVLFIKEKNGRYLMLNKATAALFARTVEEMLGKTDEELSLAGFAGDRSMGAMERRSDEDLHELEQRAGREECLVVDGKLKWFRVYRSLIAFADFPRCSLINAVDITAARKAREKIRNSELLTRAILDSLTSRVILMDKELRIIWANQAACAHVHKDRAQVEGEHCYSLFLHDQSGACEECPALKCLSSGQPSAQMKKTEKGRSWLVHALPILNAQGEIVSVVEVADDITERLSLELQLRQAQKMESLGTLAGGIAHDFNNILSGVIGFSELALMKADAIPEIKEYLKEIFYAGTRATELVRQILTFSRKTVVDLQPLQVSLVIREAIRMLRSTLPTTIEIKLSIANNLAPVLADPTQIHQVIMNLCTNASHAMEPDGGVLSVTVSQVVLTPELMSGFPELAQGIYVQLQVRDTGCGIPEEHLPLIFDPYFTTKDLGEGTGLGLAVVHGIVKEYGGDIHIESGMGKGSTFTILLPATALETNEEKKPSTLEFEALKMGNVLVVDDEPAVCRITRGLLTQAGYAVTTMTNPLEALELFVQNPNAFDLVISDFTMPKLTGDKLGQQMLAIRPELPIVLMTGFNQRFTDESIQTMGFRALINKPFVKKDILNMVTAILKEGKSDQSLPLGTFL